MLKLVVGCDLERFKGYYRSIEDLCSYFRIPGARIVQRLIFFLQ